MNRRDELYNALIDTVREQGKDMEIGDVKIVLNEVEYEITMRLNRLSFDGIGDRLKKRGCPTDAGTSAGQEKAG